MQKSILLEGKKTVLKKSIHYCLNEKGKIETYKPWLGDLFAFLYDRIMEKSIFPKKFGGDINKHFQILKMEVEGIKDQTIIEFATGSGNMVELLHPGNHYIGTDISAGLLQLPKKKLLKKGFKDFELHLTDACQTPFADNIFDLAICNLSLNFFSDIDHFFC